MERDAAAASDSLIIRLGNSTELRTARPEEASELFAVIERNQERLGRWLAWLGPQYSVEDTRQFLASCYNEFLRRESLTMTIRHEGALCGAIAFHRIDQRNRSTSIGYWIDGAFEGKGIMTAACRAIVTEAFRSYGLHRIEIRCATWNHRSSAIPRRLDFVEEGILRQAERVHDKWMDLRVFSMLAQEWTFPDSTC